LDLISSLVADLLAACLVEQSINFVQLPNKFGDPCSMLGPPLGLRRVIYLGSIYRGHVQLDLLRLVAAHGFVLGIVLSASLCPANAS
jgi:hypothetical protein